MGTPLWKVVGQALLLSLATTATMVNAQDDAILSIAALPDDESLSQPSVPVATHKKEVLALAVPRIPSSVSTLRIDEPVVAPPSVSNWVAPGIPRRIDIGDAVGLTLSRHPEISRSFAALSRGRADLGMARSVWSPQLSYQANLGPNMLAGRNGTGLNDNMAGPSLFLQQQLYDFGRSKGEIGAARSTEEQRQFELEAVADELAEKSAIAFLQVKRFEMLSLETAKHGESLARLRGLIGMRVRAGISDKSDLMLAEVQEESAKADTIQAESALMIARSTLANLIGGMPSEYADPAPSISRFQASDDEPDYDSLPTVVAAEQAEKAAMAKVGQARAERYPRLGLQVGYTRNNYSYNERDNALTAFVTVSGDIYRRGNRYLVQAAEEDRNAARAARDTAILEARGRALTARQEIRGGYQRIQAYQVQEQQARTASRIFLEEYKLGKRTLTELLNIELEIYRAAGARIAAEYDILGARVRYENVFGRLRPSLGLPGRVDAQERYNG